jgi:hypothetical protein
MIVDQFGKPFPVIRRGFLNGTQSVRNLPDIPTIFEDIERSVPPFEWKSLVSAGRKLYINFGPFRAAADDKASYSIGNAFLPTYYGKDKEWGEKASRWLNEQWLPTCELRNDWWTTLFLASTNIDHSGDVGVLFTERDGFPMLQLIPAHRIGHRTVATGVIQDGQFAGLRHDRGVVFNAYGQVVGYLLIGDTEEDDRQVSASEMTLLLDPVFINQTRGFPICVHCLRELRTSMKTQEYEEFAALIAGTIGLVVHNEAGAADDDEGMTLNSIVGNPSESAQAGLGEELKIERLEGGMIRYMKAGVGEKLEQFVSDRPGEFWESFQDRLLRIAASGTGWPYELLWKMEGLSGPAVRAVQNKARRAIADRQSLLRPVAKRAVMYALSKAMREGLLEFSADWMNWGFTMPPLLSIDEGRDSAARRDDYLMGFVSMTEILTAEGRGDYRQHVKNLAVEAAIRETARRECEAEYGVKIDPRELQMRSVNDVLRDPKQSGKPGSAESDSNDNKPVDGRTNYDDGK